jgi:hypothetical protein
MVEMEAVPRLGDVGVEIDLRVIEEGCGDCVASFGCIAATEGGLLLPSLTDSRAFVSSEPTVSRSSAVFDPLAEAAELDGLA